MIVEKQAETLPSLPSRREVLSRLLMQRHVAVVVFALVLAGFVLTGQFRSKYQAHMAVLVRNERVDPIVTTTQNSTPELQGLSVSEADLNSEVQLLQTDDLLRQVVLKAGLVADGSSDPLAVAHAVKALRSKLTVSALDKTNLIDVRYESGDPTTAQRALAVLAPLYLAKNQQLHGSSFELSFFDEQVRLHKDAVDSAAQQLLAFTHRTGIVSATEERDAVLQQMAAVSQQRVTTKASLADVNGRASTLSGELSGIPNRVTTMSKQADNPQLLGQIKTTLLTLRLRRAELVAKYDPKYRLVQDVDSEIAVAQNMLAEQASSLVTETSSDVNPERVALNEDLVRARADLSGLSARGADLTRSSKQLLQTATELQAATIDQARLESNLKTERDAYQLYVDKREQARSSAALDRHGILNVVVASPPEMPVLPEHSFLFTLLAALSSGVLLGLSAAFIADIFDPTVRTPADLEDSLTVLTLEEFGKEVHTRGAAA